MEILGNAGDKSGSVSYSLLAAPFRASFLRFPYVLAPINEWYSFKMFPALVWY